MQREPAAAGDVRLRVVRVKGVADGCGSCERDGTEQLAALQLFSKGSVRLL